MIKLSRVKIIGFKSEDNIMEVRFSKEKVSILFGDNGCGKTTFLKLLNAILSENEKVLLKENVTEVEIDFLHDDKPHSISIRKNPLDLEHENKNKIMENTFHMGGYNTEPRLFRGSLYNWEEYEKSALFKSNSILFGVNRGVSQSRIGITPEEIFRFLSRNMKMKSYFRNRAEITDFADDLSDFISSNNRKQYKSINLYPSKLLDFKSEHVIIDNLSIDNVEQLILERYKLAKNLTYERVQNALFDTLSLYINTSGNDIDIDIDDDKLIELISTNKISLIDALNNTSENTVKSQLIDILNNYEKESISNGILKMLLYKMINEIEAEKVILNSINKLLLYFNEELSGNKELIVKTEKAFVKLKNGKTHSLNELSSGERHLLTFLAICIIEGSQRSFLLIDEPEISLNLKWQRKLVPLFNELLPESQLIFASHSPSISKESTNYLVKLEVM